MATNINLFDIKKPGVTIIETSSNDQELNPTGFLSEERLIVGFSRVGPFNKVIRVENVEQRNRIFGDVDTFLEKRGSYFHRFIDICLLEGPVLALNLLALDNSETGDKVEFSSFSTTPQIKNPNKIQELYAAFYSKERMWEASESNFKSIIDGNIETKNSILSFVNLSQSQYSILIKKSESNRNFDVYAHEYFGKENVPPYMNPLDKISDYFVDVKIIKGNFTDYKSLSTDVVYSKYFNSNGLKSESVSLLEGSPDFNVVLSVTGSIVPDILDGTGISYSIDNIINNSLSTVGLFCTINDDYLSSLDSEDFSVIDMVGHSLVDESLSIESINYLSYNFSLLENIIYSKKDTFTEDNVPIANSSDHYQDSVGIGNNGLFSNRITLSGTSVQSNIIPDTSLVKLNNGTKYATIKNYSTSFGNTIITYTHPDKLGEGSFSYLVDSVNSGNSEVIIKGVHGDLNLNLIGETFYLTNGISKYYFEIAGFSIDSGNNLTTFTVTDNTNLVYIDTTFKATWSSGYKILNVDQDNNKVTFVGNWDFSVIDSNLTSSTVYLKTNSGYTGTMSFTSYLINSDGNTEFTVDSVNIIEPNGTTHDLFTLSNLNELIINPYYVTFGVDSITRPNISINNAQIVYTPDILKIENNKLVSYKKTTLFSDWESGKLDQGDVYYKEITGPSIKPYYISIQKLSDYNGIERLIIDNYTDIDLSVKDSEYIVLGNKKKIGSDYESVSSSEIAFSSRIGNMTEKIIIEGTYDSGTRVRLLSTNADKLKVGDLLNTQINIEGINKNYLTPILTKKKVVIADVIYYDVTLVRPIKVFLISGNYYIERFKTMNDFTNSFNLISLSGFKMGEYHLPGNFLNKYSQLEKILGVITDTNLIDSLTDRNIVDFRYLVDSFESLITNELYPKTILSNLCEKQGRSYAILNGPSIESFTNSNAPGPVFSSIGNNRVFEASYIASGGNIELNPDFKYSHPGTSNGAKHSTVVGPYLTYIKNNGQSIKIPAGAHTSNLSVSKNRTSDRFKPAAGTIRGYIRDPRVIGVEYISENDVQYFTEIGYNPFINKRGYGIIMYGNQTNYLKESPLANLHVRDMLGTIERLIEYVLNRYVFDNNTPRTRFLVYEDLDSLLYPLKDEGAFLQYSIEMDSKNNQGTVLDGSYGIVKINIWPTSPIKSFICELNIKKGSGIEISGFNF